MANFKVTTRKVNKSTEQPACIRYSHPDSSGKSKDYFIPLGFSVNPASIKNQRIVGEQFAPEANDKITAALARLDHAIRLASAGNTQPTVDRVKYYYQSIPRVKNKIVNLLNHWNEEGKTKIEVLEHEILVLENEISLKREQITEIEKQVGIFKQNDMQFLITEFIKRKNGAKPKNATAKSKGSFSKNTEQQYNLLKLNLSKYNSQLTITEIDKVLLYDFESYMIKSKFLNGTTKTMLEKLVAVLNHFKDEFNLETDYKDYTFELPMKEESVIYLTTEELTAFRGIDTYNKRSAVTKSQDRVKDLVLLMSETALRYSDSHITPADIQGGYIIKNQQKTGSKVYIPFTERLKTILEKHNYELKTTTLINFTNILRRLLKSLNLESLNEEVTVWNYCGMDKVPDTRPKYKHIGAHTLRRTMINQCLLRNMRYDKITKITGHKDFDTFQLYADRYSKAAEMDSVFDFLNDTDTDTVTMKVA